MNRDRSRQKHIPRELRRRVALPARLRTGGSWSDACILNVSSRGLMIYTSRPMDGEALELRRGEHVIRGRVIWRDGRRMGLQAEERVPVNEIMTLSQSYVLRLTGVEGAAALPRSHRRIAADTSRMHGRAIEFIAVSLIGASLALGASSMIQSVLATPLSAASLALDGAAPDR